MGLDLRHYLALSLNARLADKAVKAHVLREIFWESTLRCNLNCRHCGSDCKLQPGQKDMPLEDFLKVLDRVKAAGMDSHHIMIVVSGGEPLLYAEAISRLFELLHGRAIRTALDTCGEVPFEAFARVLPATDLVLFDIKGMDPVRHRENTGRDNARIHENLRQLGARGVPVEIRMPVVPGRNDAEEEFEAAGRLLAAIPSVTAVRLLPYRSLARKKYSAAGLADTMPDAPTPDAAFLEARAAILRRHLSVPVLYAK